MQAQATQIFIRQHVDQGETVSVLVQHADLGIEVNLSPREALDLAAKLVKNARLSQFGPFKDIEADELDAVRAERALDIIVDTLGQIINELRDRGLAPAWPAAAGDAVN